MGERVKMKLSEDELVNLINLLLNDLDHSRWVLLEAYSQKEELDIKSHFMAETLAGVLSLARAKANMIDKLAARHELPEPNEDGMELIQFWLAFDKASREEEFDDT
jgi:hypothetical protein